MAFNRRKLADSLITSYRAASQSYATAKERDAMKQAREATATNKRVILGGSNKIADTGIYEQYRTDVWAMHDEALSSIDAYMAQAARAISEPPSDEAARYIVSISGRKNLTADEVAAALDRYSGQHAAEKAILSAAWESGVRGFGNSTEAENDVNDLRALRSFVDKAITPDKFTGGSGAYAAMTEAALDNFGNGGELDALKGLGI